MAYNLPDGCRDTDPNAPWTRKSVEIVDFNWKGYELTLEVEPEDNGQLAPSFVVQAAYLGDVDITELLGCELAELDSYYNRITRDEWMEACR